MGEEGRQGNIKREARQNQKRKATNGQKKGKKIVKSTIKRKRKIKANKRQRKVRRGGKKTRKSEKKTKQKKGKKKRQRKGRRGGKKTRKYKKKAKQNKSKLNHKARQSKAECTQTCDGANINSLKKFRTNRNQLRKAKRIQTFVRQMDKKKEKALTTFKNASEAIQEATINITLCNGGSVPEVVKVAAETPASCNTTASELCDTSTIPELNMTLVEECIPLLQATQDAYVKCLTDCDCSCFTSVPVISESCIKFTTMENNTKTAKRKCTNPSEEGSFGDCRAQERVVAYYGVKCVTYPMTTMTTKAPSNQTSVLRRLLRGKLQRHAGRI